MTSRRANDDTTIDDWSREARRIGESLSLECASRFCAFLRQQVDRRELAIDAIELLLESHGPWSDGWTGGQPLTAYERSQLRRRLLHHILYIGESRAIIAALEQQFPALAADDS